ncbi:MAG: polyphosphate polymerase domain-containing protein [Clostridia bacterium]|nr:polyphosphate polymerase domain-containing protein [Clostridia bacterium]
MDAKMTFKRYELKYRINGFQRDALLKAMEGHLALDMFGHSTIRNLYYDTDTWQLVRRSIEKPWYKEKLRVRSYGLASDTSPVFVELKKKYEKVVYKRRLSLPCQKAMEGLMPESILPAGPKDMQIGREIEAFKHFYGPTLAPAMFLSYEREAYYPIDGVDFRLTIDNNLLWRMEDIDLRSPAGGQFIIPPDEMILEVKTPGGIPMWMVRFLSENRIYQTSFSKYGTAYQHWLADGKETGGRMYA